MNHRRTPPVRPWPRWIAAMAYALGALYAAGCTPLPGDGDPVADARPDEEDGGAADGATPDPDAARPEGDGSAPALDAGEGDPDGGASDPDGGAPDPDGGEPNPDGGEPEPDAGEPDPDAGGSDPDAGGPDPDAGEPGPDAGEPDPDAAVPPEACNGLDDDRDGVVDEDGVCACDACPTGEVCADDRCVPGPATPIAAPSEAIELAGAVGDARLWSRLDADCAERFPGDFGYAALRIVNDGRAPRTIELEADWGEVDGFLHVFTDPFDPGADGGCLAGNDDFTGRTDSRIEDQPIAPGEVLVVVASTYDPGVAIPAFTVTIRTAAERPDREVACDDGLDDDGDGRIDCADDDCAGEVACDPCAACGPDERCEAGRCVEVPGDGPTPIAAVGGAIELAGELTAQSPRWRRLNEGCDPSARDTHYAAFEIVNRTGAARAITVEGRWPGVDGYVHLFTAPFDAAAPAGCLAGDDDFEGRDRSRVEGLRIARDETLVVVVSTWSSDTLMGPFTVQVSTTPDDAGREALCRDGIDQDRDGAADCADADCAAVEGCDPCAAVECRAGERCVDGACVADPVDPVDPARPVAAPGDSIVLQGSLDADDPLWARPGADCSAGRLDGFHYAAFRITNDSPAPRTIDLLGDWDRVDGYLHVYRDPLDPADARDCLAGSDDDGQDAGRSRIEGLRLAPGQIVVVLVSTFRAGVTIPAFTVTVSTRPEDEQRCADGLDDDGDGRVDCADADCADDPACARCGGVICADDEVCVGDRCVPPPPDAVAIAAPGGSIALDFDIDDMARAWGAPNGDCRSFRGGDAFYDVRFVVNRTGAARLLRLEAEWNDEVGAVLVFVPPFDPAGDMPCLGSTSPFGFRDPAVIEPVIITPGETLAIVTSSGRFAPQPEPVTVTVETLAASVDRELRCGSGGDEDGDGRTDCDDADCLLDDICLRCDGAFCREGSRCEAGACVPTEGPFVLPDPGESIDLWTAAGDDPPTWQRPNRWCDGVEAGQHAYRVVRLRNESGVSRYVHLTPAFGEMVAVYDPPFDPAAPASCFRASDPDDRFAAGVGFIAVGPGRELVVVASAVDAGEAIGGRLAVRTQEEVVQPESICENGRDDDFDDLVDCRDPDCAEDRRCADSFIIGPPGVMVSRDGELTAASPRWVQPGFDCLRSAGYVAPYEARRLYNNADVDVEVTLFADWSVDAGELTIHGADFDPDVLAPCETGPITGNRGARRDIMRDVTVPARSSIVLVASPPLEGREVGPFTFTAVLPGPPVDFEAACDDDLDDDRDGLLDCEDPDCGRSAHCDRCFDVVCEGISWCDGWRCEDFPDEFDLEILPDEGEASVFAGRLGGDQWNRPGVDCGAGDGVRRPRAVHMVGNTSGETQEVTFDVEFGRGGGALHLWNSTDLGTRDGCVAGDVAAGAERQVALAPRLLPPNQYLVAVLTAVDGDYDLTVRTAAERPREQLCDDLVDNDEDGWIDCSDTDCYAPQGPCPNPPAP